MMAEPKHCKNCGAVVPTESGRSPYCSPTCKEADQKKPAKS